MDIYKKQLIRKLKSRCSEVNDELLEVEVLFDQAVPLFCSAVSEYCSENSCDNPLDHLVSEQEKVVNSFSSNIKSVYRKIAVETHPDKGIEDENKKKLYNDANDAKKENKVDKIISIAKDLKIDIYSFDFDDIREIESSISGTESKINQIRSSYPWIWFFSSSKKRSDIISRFVLNNV